MVYNFKNILSNGAIIKSNKFNLLGIERFYQDQLNQAFWGLNPNLLSINEKSSSKRSQFKKVNKKTK